MTGPSLALLVSELESESESLELDEVVDVDEVLEASPSESSDEFSESDELSESDEVEEEESEVVESLSESECSFREGPPLVCVL